MVCSSRNGASFVISAQSIKSELAKLRDLPTPVSAWSVEVGPDSTEYPAVWVWVMLEHDQVDFATRSQLREQVRNLVRRETDDTHWAYVRFRGASETEQAP